MTSSTGFRVTSRTSSVSLQIGDLVRLGRNVNGQAIECRGRHLQCDPRRLRKFNFHDFEGGTGCTHLLLRRLGWCAELNLSNQSCAGLVVIGPLLSSLVPYGSQPVSQPFARDSQTLMFAATPHRTLRVAHVPDECTPPGEDHAGDRRSVAAPREGPCPERWRCAGSGRSVKDPR